jgi:hypothetical protein
MNDDPVTTYHYPPRVAPQPVTLHGLDAVPLANASERTAPRRTVVVERALLVGLLDAWQAWSDCVDDGDDAAGLVEFALLEQTVVELGDAIA